MKYVAGIVAATIVTLLVIGLAIVLSGALNVAATNPHASLTEWILSSAMRRSVAVRSSAIVPPKTFTDDQVRKGFEEFDEMCVACHGAPGKEKSSVGKGLRPQPPNLAEAAGRWDDGSLFWIIKNGIKMTGMPAFGPTHDDPTIWSIVAFVRRLPHMTAAQYKEWEGHAEPHGHDDSEHPH